MPRRITGFVQVLGSASSHPMSRHKMELLSAASSRGKASWIFRKPSYMNWLICASPSTDTSPESYVTPHGVCPGTNFGDEHSRMHRTPSTQEVHRRLRPRQI